MAPINGIPDLAPGQFFFWASSDRALSSDELMYLAAELYDEPPANRIPA